VSRPREATVHRFLLADERYGIVAV